MFGPLSHQESGLFLLGGCSAPLRQRLRLQVLDEVADAPPNAAFAQVEGWRKLARVHQSAECGDRDAIELCGLRSAQDALECKAFG